jgi:hypothetical protein
MADPGRARSAQWFDRQDIGAFIHRAFTKGAASRRRIWAGR